MFSEHTRAAFISPSISPSETEAGQERLQEANADSKTMALRSGDIAISVQNLSKCYQIYDAPRDRLKQFVAPRLQRLLGRAPKRYFREFWALRDISFEVKKGETLGIVGRNGSGKSTLLQIICGTLAPTGGSITTVGRIAALLELGSGFNPEFTGRENVYMNGVVLGLSKAEVDDKFDDIAAFADIGRFIEQPVKTYSSGMTVRLAFAVQAQVDPDILIVDEALSVGDARFQAKCFARLKQLKENGTSILLVTHATEQIATHCSSAILLNDGKQIETGEPRRVINRYLDLLFGKGKHPSDAAPVQITNSSGEVTAKAEVLHQLSNETDAFSTRAGYNAHEYRWGDGTVSILDFYLSTGDESYPSSITVGEIVTLAVSVRFYRDMIRPILGITVKTKDGVTISGTNSEMAELTELQALFKEGSVVQARCDFRCNLAPGDYFISIGVATRENEDIIPHDRRYDSIHFMVAPHTRFHGLADLEFDMAASRVLS
jgi:lipopolysaccharide transport system ATP-binding protein